jgi:hypothetical protein
LADLIREQLALAGTASIRAAVPHWLEVGTLLNEAKRRPDLKGKFSIWCEHEFLWMAVRIRAKMAEG